jgi:hypothetical protein
MRVPCSWPQDSIQSGHALLSLFNSWELLQPGGTPFLTSKSTFIFIFFEVYKLLSIKIDRKRERRWGVERRKQLEQEDLQKIQFEIENRFLTPPFQTEHGDVGKFLYHSQHRWQISVLIINNNNKKSLISNKLE